MQLTLTLPEELARNFRSVEELRRTVYEDFVIEQRQSGAISLSKAAELLDITYGEFFALLGRKGLSFINAASDELQDSYQRFENLMEHQLREI